MAEFERQRSPSELPDPVLEEVDDQVINPSIVPNGAIEEGLQGSQASEAEEAGEEEYSRPPPEVYVVRKGRQEELLEYCTRYCRPLYGSDALVDNEGSIFYLTWRQVKREKVGPENHSLLSRTRLRPETYLAQRLVTKRPVERIINRVTKDEGSVEAAIRSVEHALTTELKKERPQMTVVRRRIGELFDLFVDFSAVTDDQLEEARRATYARLAQIGFDPQRVLLEEKKRIGHWLPKASGGRDSLSRRNWLISMMALQAANRRTVERELAIGHAVSKFARMRESLRFAREFSREIFEEVAQRLEPQRMPAHSLFKYPERPPQNLGIAMGILKTMSWQVVQTPVKRYLPAGLKARDHLQEAISLLEQNQRTEIVERDLFGRARGILIKVLNEQKDIYPD